MDSRLLAGAYSQHYRALEKEAFADSDKVDSITRAKRLSQETNKRRKFQAQKRKQEVQREERRRQDILSKRREEQKQATEKYQRSHIAPGSRHTSGRISPQRYPGTALEDALRLIRGKPDENRSKSGQERKLQAANETEDPMLKSYFDQRRSYISRPGSGKSSYQMDSNTRADLMDSSMKNWTNSRSLFEKQLEQQQNLLQEQQQQSLREFNDAIQKEIEGDQNVRAEVMGDTLQVEENGIMSPNDSCSSLDSLEGSKESRTPNYIEISTMEDNVNLKGPQQRQLPVSAHRSDNLGQVENSRGTENAQFQQEFYLHSHIDNENIGKIDNGYSDHTFPLNQDMTSSATYQKKASLFGMPRPETDHSKQNIGTNYRTNNVQNLQGSYVGLTRADLVGEHAVELSDTRSKGSSKTDQKFQSPLKQFSSDSLAESDGSSSNVSVIKESASVYKSNHGGSASVPPHNVVTTRDTVPHSEGERNVHENVVGSTSHLAWMSPSPRSDSSTLTPSPRDSGSEPVPKNTFNPRYASAIGVSILPGSSHTLMNNSNNKTSHVNISTVNSQLAQNVNKTTEAVSALVPVSMMTVQGTGSHSSTSYTMGTSMNYDPSNCNIYTSQPSALANNEFLSLNKQDFNYPMPVNHQPYSNKNQSLYQPQPHYSQANGANASQHNADYSSNQTRLANMTIIPSTPIHSYHQLSSNTFQQWSVKDQQISATPQGSASQHVASQPNHQGHNVMSGAIPVPAVRTIFPTSRPPPPNKDTSLKMNAASSSGHNGKSPVGPDKLATGRNTEPNLLVKENLSDATNEEEDVDVEEEAEDVLPLRSILKPAAQKATGQNNVKVNQAKVYPRDSLELKRMQDERKGQKKSVRFAENFTESTEEELDKVDSNFAESMNEKFGVSTYKLGPNRPMSATIIPTTQKLELATKAPRAASAGVSRQGTATSAQTHISKVQQTNGNANAHSFASDANSRIVVSGSMLNTRSNLPPSHVNQLNTTPINRPKAAAHIIMSTEAHSVNKGNTGTTTAEHVLSPSSLNMPSSAMAATAHKSQLDTKVKTVNNNFMSKVPVKIPTSIGNNGVVYHVASSGASPNSASNIPETRDLSTKDESLQLEQQSQVYDRSKSSANKRAPSSNIAGQKASIISASHKATLSHSNAGNPSYAAGNENSNVPVYNENGMRIDRTPTDEEITWLWDKVRNCLNKEEDRGNSKVPPNGNSSEFTSRPAPILSTKIIDGNSLGFGNNSTCATGLRTGSGFFYTRASNGAGAQNKVKPALQQQGSYLRRYGLLKQRRVNSASALGPSSAIVGNQRVASAAYNRAPSVQVTTQQQLQQQPPPTPMAFAYRPQDNVSESTAAFMMAEKLAKQALSDSQIHAGMDDAQNKQEVYNRARMVQARGGGGGGGGPSALSIEEQRLMESLDKLNDRLKVTETKFDGTIHYHQSYQAHLPGFRGHQQTVRDNRHHGVLSPRGQQRAQSARVRLQTRQYR